MSFYIGKGVPGEPGFEMKEFEGFPVSPNGKYWGSKLVDNNGNFIDEIKHKSKYHK